MTYKIIDGYVIHDAPVYPVDDEGVPTFLDGNDRFWWKMNIKMNRKQTRYSASGFYPPRERDEREEKDGKAYVCYTYLGGGCQWRECVWEELT